MQIPKAYSVGEMYYMRLKFVFSKIKAIKIRAMILFATLVFHLLLSLVGCATSKKSPTILYLGGGLQEALWDLNGTRVLTYSEDQIYIWDFTHINSPTRVFYHESRGVRGAQWSHDETRILAWSVDHNVRVWNVRTTTFLLELPHDASVISASWSQDDSHILTGTWDGETGYSTIQVWDFFTGQRLFSVRQDGLVDFAWNQGGTLILSWSRDHTVRVWNAHEGSQLLLLQHDGAVGERRGIKMKHRF
jgi:WD40 repeat protein